MNPNQTRTSRLLESSAVMASSALAAFLWASAASAQGAPPATRPAGAPAAQPVAVEDFGGRYGMLAEKNIFVRNRPPTRRNGGAPAVSSGPRRPEESLVLTGIAIQEGRHVAFIENSASRSTQRLRPGDTVAGGKVVAVDFDGLDFESDGRKVRVAIGRNFLGTTYVAPPSGNGGGSGATTAPSGGDGAGPAAPAGGGGGGGGGGGDGNLSAIERMMRDRRRNQGGAQ